MLLVVSLVSGFLHSALEMVTGTWLLRQPMCCHEFSSRGSQEPIFALTFLDIFLEPLPRSLPWVPMASGDSCIWASGDRGHQP